MNAERKYRFAAWWAFVATAMLVATYWFPFWEWADSKPNLANWVGALGTVVAIGGAVLAIQLQHRLNINSQLERDSVRKRQQLHALAGMADQAAIFSMKIALNTLPGQVLDQTKVLIMRIEAEAARDQLSAIDAQQITLAAVLDEFTIAHSASKMLALEAQTFFDKWSDDNNEQPVTLHATALQLSVPLRRCVNAFRNLH